MFISLIAAVDKSNNGIGCNGRLPWTIPLDTQHFRTKTSQHIVVMGNKTFTLDCKAAPLDHRVNIVLTDTPTDSDNPNLVFLKSNPHGTIEYIETNFKTLIAPISHSLFNLHEVFICGGSSIYHQFLPIANKLYLTEIEFDEPVSTDRFFPDYSKDAWMLSSTSEYITFDNGKFKFNEYMRY
jgi:dihydrofolate reductase